MQRFIRLIMVSLMLCGLFAASVALAEDGGKITVKVHGLRNDSGTVSVMLFKSEEGFPIPNDNNIFSGSTVNITAGLEGEAVFENVPYGEYAVTVLHDENSNQQIDLDGAGMPLEGVGSSNNSENPTDYVAAKFTLDSSEKMIEINMLYFK